MTAPDADVDHVGELVEAEYGFVCWTVCSCGWRSQGYRSSAVAWEAHNLHVEFA